MFDVLRAVECFLGDLTGRLLFHEALIADDRLVGDGTTHVVDGTTAWDQFTCIILVFQHMFRNPANGQVEQERYIGVAEHRTLFMSLAEETNDFRRVGLHSHPLALGLLDVLGRNQVQHDRHEAGILDAFVTRRRIVDRDSRPQDLPRSESAAGWVESVVELIDLVGEKATDRGTEDPGELSVQEMTQRALESLAIAGVIAMTAR